MRILWIVNIVFPKVCQKLGLAEPVSGGWLYARAEQLRAVDGISLAVATVYKGNKAFKLDMDGIRYYLLPVDQLDKYQPCLEERWRETCADFGPDLVHINGTEYPHGLACMNALPHLKYAVSIQGLVSVISRYYYGGMSFREIARNTSLLELVTGRSIWGSKRGMVKRGTYEFEYISRAHAISGRTTWDLAHVRVANPSVPYYSSPRALRSVFYTSPTWNIDKMTPHTIFLSKGTSPFKGMHQVIKAVALLLPRYPDLQIRVAGKDMLGRSGWDSKLRITAYPRYLAKLAGRLGLRKHLYFTGRLTAQQMAAELLNANVFICPSAIENSSNSIAEAQMLGVPTIASDAGGNMDMVEHGITGFIYRFEEHELLAHFVARIFEERELASRLSKAEIQAAGIRHEPKAGLQGDLRMYADLMDRGAFLSGEDSLTHCQEQTGRMQRNS
ncbi:MAG TPA: glycosyltransferase family 4 protein [Candidatus Syntrophosphaera sp.]|nr:glycosyltransferase family 4 protein [Candidatus Cloacimonadota bacterium]HOR02709.1 glycosyltransferase family 4 protein [Candidatus Syntrophosphaera sp.]